MIEIISFYLISLLVGVSFFWLSSNLFDNFVDKGFQLGKILGLLLVTYIYWILHHITKIEPVVQVTIGITTLYGIYKFYDKDLYKKINKDTYLAELIYILAFTAFIIFRSINPRIEGIEKMMDLGLINSLSKSVSFPATDVWYATKTINYYYFGQVTPAILIRNFHFFPGSFYNIYISHIFAISVSAAFSLGYSLTKGKKYGFLLVFLLLLAGNLDLVVKKFQMQASYYYAEARSLIENAITEFPSYSFLISDLHAHVLNLPNVLLALSLLYSVAKSKIINKSTVFILSFVLGVCFVTNSWDFLIYMPLSFILINSKQLFFIKGKKANYKELLYLNLLLTIPALVLFIPFHLSFEPAVKGFGINKDLISIKTIILMFGSFLGLTLPFLLTLKMKKVKDPTVYFSLLLVIWGYLLILVPQVVFLKDIYFTANPPFYKANTVFKVWFQAWVILSFASVYTVKHTLEETKKYFKWVLLSIYWIIILFIAIYPVNGIYYLYRTNTETRFKNINGYEFLEKQHKDELEAINWINKEIKTQVTILEKPGDAYTTDSLFSTFTGNPTLVGWSNHEFGWRGNWDEIAKIMMDVQTMYTSKDTYQVKTLLENYGVNYVVIGPKENQQYGQDAGSELLDVGTIVFQNSSVKLIKIKTKND